MALARPVCRLWNARRYISTAMTLVCCWDDSGISETMMSKIFSTLMIMVMKTTISTGRSSGKVT